MAPRSAQESDNSAAVITLCYMMMGVPDFRADNNYLAPILGLTGSKNVPRKINSLINPHGFEYKGNQITVKDPNNPPVIQASVNSTTVVNSSAIPPTPKAPKTPKTPVNNKKSNQSTPSKKSAKKRKIEEVAADDDVAAVVKGEDDVAAAIVKDEDKDEDDEEDATDAGLNKDDAASEEEI